MDLFGDLPPPSDEKDSNSVSKDLSNDTERKRKNEETEYNNIDSSKKKKTDEIFVLKSYIAERKGEREDMQDAATLMDDCTKDFQSCDCGIQIERVSFFGVYDGHGGNRASTYLKEHLHENIRKNFPQGNVTNFDKELKKCLMKAFKQTDDEFINKASQVSPPWRDGSTASCVFIVNNTIYAANVGDTKTIIVRKDEDGTNKFIALSKDHSPTDYSERQRIQNAGGFVREGRVQGVLEVSRAFGDIKFKKYVVSTPEVCKSTLSIQDRYLLIACDGLWKGFSVGEAVSYIDKYLEQCKNDKTDVDTKYENVCKEIASEAIRRGSSDNVTVLIVRIAPTHS